MSAEAQEVATEVGAAVSDAVNSEEAKQAAEAVKQAAEAVAEGAADAAQKGAEGAKQAYDAAAPVVADAAQKGAEGATQAYNAAAPVVADAAQKGAEGATQAYNAAAPVVADAAQKGAEGATQAYNAAAPVVADAARKGAEGATQAYNAAAPVVADAAQKGGELAKQGAQKTAAAASRGAKKAAPRVTAAGRRAQAAAKTGYRVATPVVHQLGDAATDVLSNIPPPDIHFDSAAAKSALMGGASMGMMAASAAATGCAAFAADILKLEIFRDFYQFLSIFFSSLKMPDSFNVFFGNVAALLSMGFTRMIGFFTSVQAAMNPTLWFWVFLLLAIVCWIRLSCLMDTGKFAGLKMLSKKDKDKMNWKEINKTSMFKFKQVKYLLLALTTLYTPVTRNALQMALCAPKYAYANYECFDNTTNAKLRTFYLSPQEDNAVGTCVDGYMQVATASALAVSAKYQNIISKTCRTYSDASTTGTYSSITTIEGCKEVGNTATIPNYKKGTEPLSESSDKYPAGCYWDGNLRFNTDNTSIAVCTDTGSCFCNFESTPASTPAASTVKCGTFDCPTGLNRITNAATTECSGATCDAATCCQTESYFAFSSGTNCTANNKTAITTKADCTLAGLALGIISAPNEARDTAFSSYPVGCSGSPSRVYWKALEEPYDCSSIKKCLCKNADRRRRSLLGAVTDSTPETSTTIKHFLRSDDTYEWQPIWEDNFPSIYEPLRRRSLASNANVPRGYYGTTSTSVTGNTFLPVPKKDKKLVLKMEAQFPVCYEGNHMLYVVVSFFTVIFFSLAFPRLMGKVIEYEKPKPIDPEDPENPVFHPPPQTPDPTTGVFTPTPSYDAKMKLYNELHGKPVIFNDEGKLVEYTDEIFLLEVVKRSASPFTTMYKGFEMSWAKYKIFVMDLKLVQILFMTLATCELLSRRAFTSKSSAMFASIAAIATTGLFLIMSCKANPYVDPTNDRMEMVSKVTLIITPMLVLLSALVGDASLAMVVGILLNGSAVIGNGFMIWMTVSAMACCKTKMKKWQGTLAFSSPDGLTLHPDNSTLPDWNLDTERKRRIWKPFWDKIFNEDKTFSGALVDKEEIKANNGKKYLPKEAAGAGHDGTILMFPLKRFEEQLAKLRTRGFEAFQSGVMPMSKVEYNMRMQFQTMFEGPDVFCDDAWLTDSTVSSCKDGNLDSTTNFCRLEIEPYPYCLKMFWDGGGKDWGEVPSWGSHADRLKDLWNMQCRPNVVQMKNVRLKLRGAHQSGAPLYHPVERDVQSSRQVKDGKDEDGKQKYKTEHFTIHYNYTNGKVNVAGDYGNSEFEQGFKVSMHYKDGEGVETSGSQRGKQHHNGQWTIGEQKMGINPGYQYAPGSALAIIFGETQQSQQNANHIRNGVMAWQQKLREYRTFITCCNVTNESRKRFLLVVVVVAVCFILRVHV